MATPHEITEELTDDTKSVATSNITETVKEKYYRLKDYYGGFGNGIGTNAEITYLYRRILFVQAAIDRSFATLTDCDAHDTERTQEGLAVLQVTLDSHAASVILLEENLRLRIQLDAVGLGYARLVEPVTRKKQTSQEREKAEEARQDAEALASLE